MSDEEQLELAPRTLRTIPTEPFHCHVCGRELLVEGRARASAELVSAGTAIRAFAYVDVPEHRVLSVWLRRSAAGEIRIECSLDCYARAL